MSISIGTFEDAVELDQRVLLLKTSTNRLGQFARSGLVTQFNLAVGCRTLHETSILTSHLC